MADKKIGKKAKRGVFWTILFSMVQYVIRFGSSIALARILFPEDFGLMGMATIFINMGERLAHFGFGTVIIQRKEIRSEHLDTVLVFNLTLMGTFTLILFLAAPHIGSFFNNPNVVPVVRAISVIFLLKACSSVSNAVLRRNMMFKELGIARTTDKAIKLISPVGFALAGFGVWSLVYGSILGSLAGVILTFYFSGWVPRFRFRWWALKETFSFGIWVYISNLINYAIENIDYLIIGRFLNAGQLGYYERAFNLMSVPRKRTSKAVNDVLLSSFSRLQDEDERLVRALKKVVTSISLIAYSVNIWFYFVAPALITVLFGPRWVPSIKPLQIMCISGFLYTYTRMLSPLILARGLVSQNALRQFIYLLFLSTAVYIGVNWGITGVAWAVVVSSVFFFLLNLHLIHRYIPITLKDLFIAQKSAMIYGLIQILVLTLFLKSTRGVIAPDGPIALVVITLISFLAFVGSHLVLRFKDVQGVFAELFEELAKMLRKIPGLGWMGYSTPKAP